MGLGLLNYFVAGSWNVGVPPRRGKVGGRKRQMTESKIETARKLFEGGTPPKDIAKNLGVSIPTLYRWLPASTRS